MPIFGAAYAAPNKGTTILYQLRPQKTVLNPPVNDKIQRLFKALECFTSTFKGSSTFQVCANPVLNIQVNNFSSCYMTGVTRKEFRKPKFCYLES